MTTIGKKGTTQFNSFVDGLHKQGAIRVKPIESTPEIRASLDRLQDLTFGPFKTEVAREGRKIEIEVQRVDDKVHVQVLRDPLRKHGDLPHFDVDADPERLQFQHGIPADVVKQLGLQPLSTARLVELQTQQHQQTDNQEAIHRAEAEYRTNASKGAANLTLMSAGQLEHIKDTLRAIGAGSMKWSDLLGDTPIAHQLDQGKVEVRDSGGWQCKAAPTQSLFAALLHKPKFEDHQDFGQFDFTVFDPAAKQPILLSLQTRHEWTEKKGVVSGEVFKTCIWPQHGATVEVGLRFADDISAAMAAKLGLTAST